MGNIVEIFTDGACRGNPGPGGYGAIMRYNGQEKTLSGSEYNTTNNRMELMGVIIALQALTRPCEVSVTTDSKYVMDGITKWLPQWQLRGWRTASNQPVKNLDLWQSLLEATKPHMIEWHWVKGHSGHVENERCDQLANEAIDALMAEKKE